MHSLAKLYEDMEKEPADPHAAANIFEHKERKRVKVEQLGAQIAAQYAQYSGTKENLLYFSKILI